MLKACLLVALSLVPFISNGQDSGGTLASGLKRALIFGDQTGMSQRYVNTDAVHKKSAPVLGARESFNKGDDFFSRGKFASAFMHYNVGFDIFLSIMNGKKLDSLPKTSDKINVYTMSQQLVEKKINERPMIEKALENWNLSYFGPEEYWEFTRGLDAAALYYQVKGNFDKADVLYLKALALRGEQFGKTSEPYVCSLGNLATLRIDQGNFAAAEDMLNYLVKFYTKAKGKGSPEYLLALNNKAMLDAKLGRTQLALHTLEEVIQGIATLPSTAVLDAQRIRTNHALLLAENNRSDQAILQLKEIMQILEQNNLDNHTDYHSIAIYLGMIYMKEGLYEKSLEVIDASIKKISNTLGNAHPIYLKAMSVKAEYFLRTKAYGGARDLYNIILPSMEEKYGIRNKMYLDVAVKNAYCLWKTNNAALSKTQFEIAIREYLKISDMLFTSMSEDEQSKFWRMLKPQLDLFYYFVSENYFLYPELIEQSFNLHLKTKGLLINNSRKTRERILKNKDSNLIHQYKAWLQMKESLAGYYNMEKEDLVSQGIELGEFENQINVLERKLVLESSIFKNQDTHTADWKVIQQALTSGEVAIEILRIKPIIGDDQTVRYMALILSSADSPALVNFLDGDRMESKDITFFKNSIQFKIEDKVTYERFWKPLLKNIPANSTIYFSADGVYNSINLNVLKTPSGSYLIDDYQLIYLSNTRFLTQYKKRLDTKASMSGSALLIGNPEFGNSENVTPLPGTLTEINKIENILKDNAVSVLRLTGIDATKSAFKAMSRPELLHIATHGFFLKDVDNHNGLAFSGDLFQSYENPLFKSGLLLAGASNAIKHGVINFSDESILTAYEAMNLDLEYTHLVVLSACETGMGEIVNGEGVYGLIRSFQVAGAEATILSLWKVDDEATQQLMVNFYQFLSKTGDLAFSFRKAQQELRATYPDPIFWGAFVLYL